MRFVPIGLTLLVLHAAIGNAQTPAVMRIPAPEFRGVDTWINSDPLLLKEQKGTVVVLHFWTFG